MGNYYFLVPSLPQVDLDRKPDISFEELKVRLSVNLSKKDQELASSLMRFTDVTNICSLIQEEAIDPKGNLSEKELDEALLVHTWFPQYVFDFFSRFEKIEDRIRYFSVLTSTFFREEIPKAKGFLKRYFTFEREWRLVLVALRAKLMGVDVVAQLQFEDFTDPLVADILAQKDLDHYQPPSEYLQVVELMHAAYPDPWELHKGFSQYRLSKIDEMVENSSFSIDVILAYMARLMIIEQYHALDEERGKRVLETFTH